MDRMATEWALFVDWCTATGRQHLPATRATVQAFFDQIPASPATLVKRARAIRRHHETALTRPPIPLPDLGPNRITPDDQHWPTLRAALGRCPAHGPHALAGRRDAWILVLRKVTGLTRTQIRNLDASHVDVDDWHINDRPIPHEQDTRACPRCATARWLALLAVVTTGFRSDARALMRTPRLEAHACTHPIPTGWHEAHTLTPSIDQHAWFADLPLSSRALAAVTSTRMAAQGPWDELVVPQRVHTPVDVAAARQRLEDLLDDLDEANDRADQAIAQMQFALSADADAIRQWHAQRSAEPTTNYIDNCD